MDVALDEERAHVGVEAGREENGSRLERLAPELAGIRRSRECVQVDDAVERVVLVLVGDPVAYRAQVVAEVDVAGRLDARKDPRHGGDAMRRPRGPPR